MKKMTTMILTLILVISAMLCGAAAGEQTEPNFMRPAYFSARFNATMEALADKYADHLGEDGVRILKESFTLVSEEKEGSSLSYRNSDSNITATFIFADAASVTDNDPALTMNLVIHSDVPEIAAYLSRYALQMMIGFDFQEEVPLDDLVRWFDTAEDPSDIFQIPGYPHNVIKTDSLTMYAVLPPADRIPQLNENPDRQ